MPIPTRARTSALGGYVTGHGGYVTGHGEDSLESRQALPAFKVRAGLLGRRPDGGIATRMLWAIGSPGRAMGLEATRARSNPQEQDSDCLRDAGPNADLLRPGNAAVSRLFNSFFFSRGESLSLHIIIISFEVIAHRTSLFYFSRPPACVDVVVRR
jgi:hypothetical protein